MNDGGSVLEAGVVLRQMIAGRCDEGLVQFVTDGADLFLRRNFPPPHQTVPSVCSRSLSQLTLFILHAEQRDVRWSLLSSVAQHDGDVVLSLIGCHQSAHDQLDTNQDSLTLKIKIHISYRETSLTQPHRACYLEARF